MATREEMCKMINAIEGEGKRWFVRIDWGKPGRFPDDVVKEIMWHALRHAEANGKYYNGVYVKDEPCTYWLVGDYIVTYLTDDPVFNADMLTEEMMDDLDFFIKINQSESRLVDLAAMAKVLGFPVTSPKKIDSESTRGTEGCLVE